MLENDPMMECHSIVVTLISPLPLPVSDSIPRFDSIGHSRSKMQGYLEQIARAFEVNSEVNSAGSSGTSKVTRTPTPDLRTSLLSHNYLQ